MKKSTFIVFFAYIWTKTLFGLTFSPYKSLRDVSRRPVLLPVVLSPLYGLAALFVLGRVGSIVFEVTGYKRTFMAFLLSSGLISLLLWQLLLVYLLISFFLAFKNRR